MIFPIRHYIKMELRPGCSLKLLSAAICFFFSLFNAPLVSLNETSDDHIVEVTTSSTPSPPPDIESMPYYKWICYTGTFLPSSGYALNLESDLKHMRLKHSLLYIRLQRRSGRILSHERHPLRQPPVSPERWTAALPTRMVCLVGLFLVHF